MPGSAGILPAMSTEGANRKGDTDGTETTDHTEKSSFAFVSDQKYFQTIRKTFLRIFKNHKPLFCGFRAVRVVRVPLLFDGAC